MIHPTLAYLEITVENPDPDRIREPQTRIQMGFTKYKNLLKESFKESYTVHRAEEKYQEEKRVF